ncbi:MAG TPA: hypothetical protein VFW96_05330 [Thermomicrobiales bacterium]|nr:hypothetical protein [Thermomicrobiales bacterium]
MTNEYSRAWFDTFLAAIPDVTTNLEVRGLARWLPLSAYRAVLDVCRGPGRQAPTCPGFNCSASATPDPPPPPRA